MSPHIIIMKAISTYTAISVTHLCIIMYALITCPRTETDDWNDAVIECSSLAVKWKELSLYLRLSCDDIDSIKDNNPKDNSGCLCKAMDYWIKQNYDTTRFGLPSWRTLLTAVARVDKRLCKELAIKHQGNSGVSKI